MKLTTTITPKHILAIYQDKDTETYIEHIWIKDGKPLSARPLTREVFKEIIQASEIDSIRHDPYILDSSILYHDEERVIWTNKPCTKELTILNNGKEIKLTYYLPKTIWFSYNKELWIYGYKGKLSLQTILMSVQLPNTSSGHVCTGNVNIDIPDSPNEVKQYWEKLFWNSYFTKHGDWDNPSKKLNKKLKDLYYE